MRPRALCFDHPHMEWWFADAFTAVSRGNQERAKAICRVCPVRVRCLSEARGRQERYGIWGGECFDRNTRRSELVLT